MSFAAALDATRESDATRDVLRDFDDPSTSLSRVNPARAVRQSIESTRRSVGPLRRADEAANENGPSAESMDGFRVAAER